MNVKSPNLKKLGTRIVISRTDNLGDVILTLPLAGYLKTLQPDLEILFIGKKYTQPLIEQCSFIKRFLDRDEVLATKKVLTNLNVDTIFHVFPDKKIAWIAKRSGIKQRVGTSHRWFHWLTCNQLVNFSRSNSTLHESQLNFKLLKPFGFNDIPKLDQLVLLYGLHARSYNFSELFSSNHFNLIIHPKSKGSAREWSIQNYYTLIQSLPVDSYRIFITGTNAEGELIRKEIPAIATEPHVVDLTGKFDLYQLTSFIQQADGLLACSTGVLHIAAAVATFALGLYVPKKPIHPGRWMPVGKKARHLVTTLTCTTCNPTNCQCINALSATEVKNAIEQARTEKLCSQKKMNFE
ncbi:MAG: glycosyltransferase family 9 protein [Cyclobacteriaceae bacterium]|nr:glycosyltransferase family 9 protein [Cyclobacteriaceae bacterium]